jgi:hypothetical protein
LLQTSTTFFFGEKYIKHINAFCYSETYIIKSISVAIDCVSGCEFWSGTQAFSWQKGVGSSVWKWVLHYTMSSWWVCQNWSSISSDLHGKEYILFAIINMVSCDL